MRTDPMEEPCGCNWTSADQPFKTQQENTSKPHPDYEHDEALKQFTECIECGAVWETRQDNAWVKAGEQAAHRARAEEHR